MKVSELKRVFVYGGMSLADPDASIDVDGVRDIYANTYPELSNSSVDGPKISGDTATYEFVRAVRTKG